MTSVVDKKLSLTEIWRLSINSLRSNYISTLKSAFFFCILLSLSQFFLSYGLRLLYPDPISEQQIITHRIIEIFWSVFISIIFSIAVTYGFFSNSKTLKESSLTTFVKKHFKLVTIESFRSMFVILIYFFLFIIPGFIKIIHLLFVPFVVQLYKPYQAGKVDALQKSKELINGALLGIGSIYFIFQIFILLVELGIPAQLQKWFLIETSSFYYFGLEFFCVVLLGTFIEIASIVVILKIFESLVIIKEGKNELAI